MPGTLPELLALSDDEAANKIEVFKKVRGVSEKLGEEFTRTVLHLHPRLAPITVAVFPLKKNEPRLVELARGVKKDLQAAGLRAVYDDTGAIGKLYRRQDEIGTPFCITVDFQSLEDKTRHGARPRHDGAGAGRRRRAGLRAAREGRVGEAPLPNPLPTLPLRGARGPDGSTLPLPLAGEGRGEGKPCERQRSRGVALTMRCACDDGAAAGRAARPSGRA